jgi:DNA mismatch repair protein MutL
MSQIIVLDQNMINMIAAGEVIERPASVVKELMENSIDAGAIKISVSVEDGGRRLISVSDNGCGMDSNDLAMAFEPHATSKVKTSKDLSGISTLGFRGEALASIASVAQVKVVSRINDSASAHCMEIDCGEKSTVQPCSGDYGTTIQVRDIFYKLPARRKFLRTANTEMGHITEQLIRLALAHSSLDMELTHNGKVVYRLSGQQDNRQRITELLPSAISEDLIETESNEKGLHISAFLGKPGTSRTSNKFQYIFLNGRFIRDKFISHAIKEAYHGILEPNRYPVVFLFLQMPCEDYDVNVHPTKIEVRFYNANLVHSQILGCLREKLLGMDHQTQARLPITPDAAERPIPAATSRRSREIADAMAEFLRKHKPTHTQQHVNSMLTTHYKEPPFGRKQVTESVDFSVTPIAALELKYLQIHDSFIVEQTDDGFLIIDQHALHERILFENLRRRIQNGVLESQRLLVPETFELTESQIDVLENHPNLMKVLGIEIAPFGPRTYAIQAFPVLLKRAAPAEFVQDLIDLLDSQSSESNPERLLDAVLSLAACKAAIKAGQKLSNSEIEQLLSDRKSLEFADRCPHGRPTTIKFSIEELEKQFKRT